MKTNITITSRRKHSAIFYINIWLLCIVNIRKITIFVQSMNYDRFKGKIYFSTKSIAEFYKLYKIHLSFFRKVM